MFYANWPLQECFNGFPDSLDWFNCSALSLDEHLHHKLLILDFFTYCCINCIHVLPDLHAVEHQYKHTDGLVVVGVHSAKFDNEKDSQNILNAILRYDIDHPVVNDCDGILWSQMGVSGWPTMLVVSPDRRVLHQFVGEGHRDNMLTFVGAALKYYERERLLDKSAVTMSLAKDQILTSPLKFPGKVCVDVVGDRLFVSDTGHHRIVVINMDGLVIDVIGGPIRGFQDGDYNLTRFHAPQGLVWCDDILYVADTDNHVIRKVEMLVWLYLCDH